MTDEHIKKNMGVLMHGGLGVLAGTIAGALMSFGTKVIITQFSSPSVFGVFSLFFGIVSMIYMLSTFGLSVGITRYIAFFSDKEDNTAVSNMVYSVMRMGILISVVICVIAILSADFIVKNIFPEVSHLGFLLKVTFITIPFFSLLDFSIGVARGFKDVKPKVFLLDIIKNLLFLLILIISIPISFSITSITYSYTISVIVPGILSYIYISNRYGVNLLKRPANRVITVSKREFFLSSLPLTVMPLMWLVLGTMDTVMLGYFKNAEAVGIYNASASLARFFNVLISPITFIFLPVATQYLAKSSASELSYIYKVTTKWIFSISLPFFFLLIFFPDMMLVTLYGADYAQGALCLRIVVSGYLSSLILGINNVVLTASGKYVVQMWLSISTILLNLLLNILLIPKYGASGAAAATAISYTAFNVLAAVVLYRHSAIHPFSVDFFKAIIAAVLTTIVFFVLGRVISIGYYSILPILVLYCLSYLCCVILLFKGVTKYDIIIINLIEQKSRLNFGYIKGFISRFGGSID